MPTEAERLASQERLAEEQVKGQIPSAEKKTGELVNPKARTSQDKARKNDQDGSKERQT